LLYTEVENPIHDKQSRLSGLSIIPALM